MAKKRSSRERLGMQALGIFLIVYAVKFLNLELATKNDFFMLAVATIGFCCYVFGGSK